MGDFPEDFQVETWRLIQLWIAEGFIRTSSGSHESLEEVAKHYLEDLISRNLIMARKKRFNGEVKVCGIHDLLREFCLIEAEMTKFMHVVRTPFSPGQKPNFRRFSIEKYIEDAYKLLPPVARSMYCFSNLDLPFEPRIKLLPILPIYRHDPIIHEFFSCFNHLRVLAIFPAWFDSISELLNLQTLICDANIMYITLPRKIWMMKNLRYIRLRAASYFPSPRIDKNLVTGMPNLEELFGLCYSSCTNEVFSSIPNLKRLTIHAPLMVDNVPYHLLDMSSLRKLEAFKLSWRYVFAKPIKRFVFPKSLRRLSLARCYKFIWEEISSTFIKLPHLEELKLKYCRADDDIWRLNDKDIFNLQQILLSELNLKHWEASSDNFPNLKCLILKNCEFLQEIPTDFGEICTLESIELHDCTTISEDSARNIEQEQEDMGNNILKVYIRSCHTD
ncbi:putative late blight resistance protein homolog R1A-10 isoform X1 [Solanum tuberosum]|uniref:putative late blight resistance protein homolog R1A-10 isoform X1 n=1 Tax=Solanum tuberosum TaxID=4113 RepID=UPI00073A0A5B|nr:PREDICTED: putative late blight resistance protein homolog R1A-10 isoform X1 [Solanum tuberosum]